MKEHLNEENMRRENEPVSTTLDVGLNNNQLERETQSPTGFEDIENENFWESDSVGLSANYEWSSESASSDDDAEESLPEYVWTNEEQEGQQRQQEIRPNNWKSERRSVRIRGNGSARREGPTTSEKSGDYFWSDNGVDGSGRRADDANECNNNNNNEATIVQKNHCASSIAGGSVNRLDVRRNNDQKNFYEKPKLNIQSVAYLYEGVLPSTVKCMNYVNSIKASSVDSLDNSLLSTPEKEPTSSAVPDGDEIVAVEEEEGVIRGEDGRSASSRSVSPAAWPLVVDEGIEVVELTKSVKEVIQFPEIEEIADNGNKRREDRSLGRNDSETADDPVDDPADDPADDPPSSPSSPSSSSSSSIEHIDLIREAKELTIVQKSKLSEIKKLSSCRSGVEGTAALGEPARPEEAEDEEAEDEEARCVEGSSPYAKIEEIDLLSSIGRDIGVDLEKYVQPVPDVVAMETVKQPASTRSAPAAPLKRQQPEQRTDTKIRNDTNKLVEDEMPDARKKEKMARNQARRRQSTHSVTSTQTRRSDKRRADRIVDSGLGDFDVYNIETAMPKIDLDAIESHLRAAREEERRENERVAEVVEAVAAGGHESPQSVNNRDREDLLSRFNRLLEDDGNVSYQRRNDREEIRRRLAMGPDAEDLRAERGRKPSLQSRLQSGMNLQICFMNETPSDTESPSSENDLSSSSSPTTVVGRSPSLLSFANKHHHQLQQQQQQPRQHHHQMASRPQILSLPPLRVETGNPSASSSLSTSAPVDEADFFARQARLQTEARMALAQAKEMAHMQMEVERQGLKQSPITEMVRSSLEKVGVQLGEDRRRLSRVLLTELNVTQLQVVANDLHARIAALNEALVEGLLRRDDLHMEQDSMLVDVEDLTRYLGAKQESAKKRASSTKEEHAQRQPQHQPSQHQQQYLIATTSKNHRANNEGTILAKTAFTRDKMMKCLSTRRAA